jgi:hypothetical protein
MPYLWRFGHRTATNSTFQGRTIPFLDAPESEDGYLLPAPASWSFCSTWSSEKLPGFYRGGNTINSL